MNRDTMSEREVRDAYQHLRAFQAVLCHEIRSPLTAIRFAIGSLKCQGHDPASRDRIRAVLERQTHNIIQMPNSLLEVSGIEYGKISLWKQPLDLSHAFARAVETIRGLIDEHGHHLAITVPRDGVRLDADAVRLEQILTNLLTNAVKYTEPGGNIWLTAEVDCGDVLIRVRDSGIGIDPVMLPHLFDPFWQAESTRDRADGGLGIGLALVRGLVDLHGGSVTASSCGLGCGSEVVVRLPACAEAKVGSPVPSDRVFADQS